MRALTVYKFGLALALLLFPHSLLEAQGPKVDSTGPVNISLFGFKEGMTKTEVITLVGAASVRKDDGDVLVLSTAPDPRPEFFLYVVFISTTTGMAEVKGLTRPIETNPLGDNVREEFKRFQTALEGKYGRPAVTFDFLHEPIDWTIGLLKEERSLGAFWMSNPESQVAVGLEAQALALDKGGLVVTYQFSNFYTWLKEHQANQLSALGQM
jgi:hypothetical protein